jgi:hypothetical protein
MTLPKSFKRFDTERVSDFCGQCHRTWDTVMRNKWHGPAFVRFQPYRGDDCSTASALDFWGEHPSIDTHGDVRAIPQFRVLAFLVRGRVVGA